MASALFLGFIVAVLHMKTSRSNQNFIRTLAILPALVAAVIALVILLMDVIHFGESTLDEKVLKIVIMEALDYTTAFDDLFSEYLSSYELLESKTTNMGSLLTDVTLNGMINKAAADGGAFTGGYPWGHW